MCGIAGTINFDNIYPLSNSLYHRGPDEKSVYNFNNINLVHTRLAIQDITHGQQPFHYQNYTIIFNGEIYNHMELRKNLEEFNFLTTSDTETLLYLYAKFKEKMFKMIDGMFAFAILDKNKKEIFLARDRAGKKPLYLYKKDKKIIFSSELNAIRSSINLDLAEESIYAYIRMGFFYNQTTPYEDVIEVEAGYYYTVNTETLNINKKKYFDILEYYKLAKNNNFKESLKNLNNILHKSVKDRLLSSDLEVGAFLSGGIDSSLIVAIASKYTSNLKTFTVKFDSSFDESYLAKLTAQKYNTKHYELGISMNLKDDVEKILLNYGEPFMDSSAIPSYYVSREAKKYVSVILNGDGADEIFGGYRRYVPIANNWIKTASYFSLMNKFLPKAHSKKSIYNYFYRLLSMSSKNGLSFYNSATNDIFEDVYKFDDNNIFKSINAFVNSISTQNVTELSKILLMDFNLILKSDLLKKMDIATMAHSLEGRSPFLSKYMLEFAPILNDSFKIKGTTTKYILRELAKQYLPKELINQPKRGFEVPLKKWVENDLKENIFDILNAPCYSQQFVKKEFINSLLNCKINVSDEKRAKMLWTLYSLEIWKNNQ